MFQLFSKSAYYVLISEFNAEGYVIKHKTIAQTVRQLETHFDTEVTPLIVSLVTKDDAIHFMIQSFSFFRFTFISTPKTVYGLKLAADLEQALLQANFELTPEPNWPKRTSATLKIDFSNAH